MDTYAVNLVAGGIVAGWAATARDPAEADGELMGRIAQRDQGAFERLYDRHSRPVFALLLRVTNDRGRAEDLLQEVFLTLWRQAEQYDAAAPSVLPWLLVIARNRALDQVRSATARRESLQADHDLDLAAAGAAFERGAAYEAGFWEREALERIRSAMVGLTPDERRVIEMAYFEGYSQTEISERIGTPLGTVKTWCRGGLAKLRSELT